MKLFKSNKKKTETKDGRIILRSLDGRFAGSLPGAPSVTPMPTALPPVPFAKKDGKNVKLSFFARLDNRDALKTLYMEKGATPHQAIFEVNLYSDLQVFQELQRNGIEPKI